MIPYARAISAFIAGGSSRRSEALLHAALEFNEEAALYLGGVRPMPREGEPLTEFEQDAVQIAEYLLPGLRAIKGCVAWVRESIDHEDDLFQDGFDSEDPWEIALDLPPGDAHWQMLLERCERGFGIILLEGAAPIAIEVLKERPKVAFLRSFVVDAIANPLVGRPRKPNSIAVTTKATLNALSKSCGTYGVSVTHVTMEKSERDHFKKVVTAVVDGASEETEDLEITNEALEAIPKVEETWVLGVFHPPMWISAGATPQRRYLTLVMCAEQGTILKHELLKVQPKCEDLIHTLRSAMVRPANGEPRRAETILVDPKASDLLGEPSIESLGEALGGVRVIEGDDQLKRAFDEVIADMLLTEGRVPQSLWASCDADEELLEQLYRVIANFYRAKPWKMVAADKFIRVTNKAWEIPERAACVMGQLGQSLGIALLDSVQAADRMLSGDAQALVGESFSLEYGEAFEAVPPDVWYQERMGWELAGPEAYPCLFRVGESMGPEPLSVEDVQVLIQLLPELPRFIDQPPGDVLEVCKGEQQLQLSWLD
ncbi:MAG: hypothetical protein AAFU85_12040 [Planctomycetota bacterium]